jgi:hypothetical protein
MTKDSGRPVGNDQGSLGYGLARDVALPQVKHDSLDPAWRWDHGGGRPWARPGEQRENAMGEADAGDGAAAYIYARFDDYVAAGGDVADEAAFWNSPRAGQPAPDFALPRLGDGGSVRLSDLWRSKPLVMEFGSLT